MEGNAKPFWYFLFVPFSTSFSSALLVTFSGRLPREQVVPGVLAIHFVANDSTSFQLLVLMDVGNQLVERFLRCLQTTVGSVVFAKRDTAFKLSSDKRFKYIVRWAFLQPHKHQLEIAPKFLDVVAFHANVQ